MQAYDEESRRIWFEKIWIEREEHVYPAIFGTFSEKIFPLAAPLFHQLGCNAVDPSWLTHAVLESPPQPNRPNWAYVTTALSNPWGIHPQDIQPGQYSGLGCELVMQSPHRAAWCVRVLQWLAAVNILTASGKLHGELIEPLDRIALGGPLDGLPTCHIRNVLVYTPDHIPTGFDLASGRVDLLLCVGITDAEMAFAQAQSSEGLLKLLRHYQYLPVTDPDRPSSV